MSHLTDEQLEDLLAGRAPEPAHLAECAACRQRLADHRATRDRLRSAFASVAGGQDLAARIRAQVRASEPDSAPVPHKSWRERFVGWRRWTAAAAAAAMIVVGVGAAIHLASTSPAAAARAELAKIHRRAISGEHMQFHATADSDELAEFFQSRLGFTPAVPRLGQGMAVRGCCRAHFRDKIVGSYVVDTPEGVISIIVVTDTPESMGMRRAAGADGQWLWLGSFARNQMATVRLNGWSYCAVGEMPQSLLIDLLSRLVPNGRH